MPDSIQSPNHKPNNCVIRIATDVATSITYIEKTMVRRTRTELRYHQACFGYLSLSLSIWLTCPGLAWPFVSCMTLPTKNPMSLSLPALYSAT